MTTILILFLLQMRFEGARLTSVAPIAVPPFGPPYQGPVYPLLYDSTVDTKYVLNLLRGCDQGFVRAPGDPNAPVSCEEGFATLLAHPETVPPNCTVVSTVAACSGPVIQDANGVWSNSPTADWPPK